MRRLEDILATIFGVVFVALAFVLTVETLVRKVLNVSLQGADELGGYALAVGSTIAFALAVIGRNHIRVDVFHERFPPRVKAFLNWLSIVLLAAMALLFVVVSWRVIIETLEYRSTAQTPWATPLIYPQGAWYAGLVLFLLVSVVFAARATRLYFGGRIERLNEEFHAKSAKEELKEELDDLRHRQAATGGGEVPGRHGDALERTATANGDAP